MLVTFGCSSEKNGVTEDISIYPSTSHIPLYNVFLPDEVFQQPNSIIGMLKTYPYNFSFIVMLQKFGVIT